MSKKAGLILLALSAFLFCFNSMPGGVPDGSSARGFAFNVSAGHSSSQHSFDLRRNGQTPNKNKIRIKAWDDYGCMAILSETVFAIKVCFYPRPYFFSRGFQIISACSSSEFLRGPPAVI